RGGRIAAARGRKTSAGGSTTRSRPQGSPPKRKPRRSTRTGASPTTRRSSSITTTPCGDRELLRLTNLVLARGAKRLLDGANLTVHAGHKVGLIGPNGSGKSSLFALIRGELHQDAGSIDLPPAWTIAHVAQETPAVAAPAIEFVLDGDP